MNESPTTAEERRAVLISRVQDVADDIIRRIETTLGDYDATQADLSIEIVIPGGGRFLYYQEAEEAAEGMNCKNGEDVIAEYIRYRMNQFMNEMMTKESCQKYLINQLENELGIQKKKATC